MEKINIAELLRDCPKGMKLDCTIYENVEFDYIEQRPESAYPIHCLMKTNGRYNTLVFTHNGCNDRHSNAKCVIFPKGKTTWEGFQRPFKDGDVLYIDCNDNGDTNKLYQYIFILKEIIAGKIYCYCYIDEANVRKKFERCCLADLQYNPRLATEEEKQKLFDAIKANGYKWNPETKTLEKLIIPKFKVGDRIKNKYIHIDDYAAEYTIRKVCDECYKTDCGTLPFENQDDYELVPDKFNISTLKPFDKVLVRDYDTHRWVNSLYGYCDELYAHKHSCINGYRYIQCIPYEENKHLLGTTNDCDDYFKTWE